MSRGLGEARTGPMKDIEGRGWPHAGEWKRKALRWERAECVRAECVCREEGVGHSGVVQCEKNGALSLELWTDLGI